MRKRLILVFLAIFFMNIIKAQNDTVDIDQSDYNLPTFNLSSDDLEGLQENQNISSLLQSSRDIFVNRAGYTFGPARFKIRGYDSEYTTVMMNGIELNDPESGRAYWASWGGLNDALRNADVNTGIVESSLGFGNIGGLTNMETRASTYRKQVKVSYSAANRSYRNRIMFISSTGMMENGWALTLSGSRRWAQEGYVTGTFYDAGSYFLSAEKKFNEHHSLGLVAYGSPNRRGKQGVSTEEAYELAGTNYYNPYWGYQSGEKRNARVSNYHQPMFILSHYWDFNKKTKLTTSAYYNFGRGGSSALSWVEAADPRPDYYKNLPSYYLFLDDQQAYEQRLELWKNNVDVRQINWDYFYFANSKFLFTVPDANGIEGNDYTGLRSKYILEEWRNDKKQLGFNTLFHHRFNENIELSAGADAVVYRGRNFKKVLDLLGGEYWLDIDKYADQESLYITDESQSDLRNPNRIVGEGDVFGYDYESNINKLKAFGQLNFSYSKLDYYIAAHVSQTTFWRTGKMQNGKFPDDSYGDSEKQSFLDYGLKGGITYKFSGRNYLIANGLFMTQAPTFRASYISPRTRDFVVSGLESEKIMSADASYVLRTPSVKSRLTFYYTEIKDRIWARSFYNELSNSFVNFIMTGIDNVYSGLEFGIDGKLTSTFSINAVMGIGQYIYDSRPKITISEDNNAKLIAENEIAYLKNYYLGGRPQTVGSFGVKYDSPRYWFASMNINYFNDAYIQLNPVRHTEDAVASFLEGDNRIDQTLQQEKFASAFTLDFFGGKSWKIEDYIISLTASVSNILNNKDFVIGGFQQYRFDPENIDKFPNKYFYLYGTTYFLNLSVRF